MTAEKIGTASPTPKITVVVLTHDRPQDLIRIVKALRQQTFKSSRMVVIDNHGPNDVKKLLQDFPEVEAFRSSENLGGAGGFAMGLEIASRKNTDWIWLLDDDALPHPTALAEFVRIMPVTDKTGILSSVVYDDNGIAAVHQRRLDRKTGKEKKLTEADYINSTTDIDVASFVGFLIRSETVNDIGLPEKDLFISYDDTEYSLRAKSKGWEIKLVSQSVVEHPVLLRLQSSPFGTRHYYDVRNRIFVLRKYCKRPFAVGLRATWVGYRLLRETRKNHKSKDGWRWFLRATVDGWLGNLGPRIEK